MAVFQQDPPEQDLDLVQDQDVDQDLEEDHLIVADVQDHVTVDEDVPDLVKDVVVLDPEIDIADQDLVIADERGQNRGNVQENHDLNLAIEKVEKEKMNLLRMKRP